MICRSNSLAMIAPVSSRKTSTSTRNLVLSEASADIFLVLFLVFLKLYILSNRFFWSSC